MIGIVVPAHNEEEHLQACLASLAQATRCKGLQGEEATVIVVLDACSDRTGELARKAGVTTLEVNARNVGAARQLGAQLALDLGCRWLAFTDADTTVAPDWLSAQLALQAKGADAVCGTVTVADWGSYGRALQLHHDDRYADRDGHRHVHGANLGVSATAYVQAGGFMPLTSSEDVALVEALHSSGALVTWSAAPRVVTSARQAFRAPSGFGATLERMAQQLAWQPTVVAT